MTTTAIALGNAPDPAAADALATALTDTEPVVRGAAAWAFGCWIKKNVLAAWALKRLAARLEIEPDATVLAELLKGLGARGVQPAPHDHDR